MTFLQNLSAAANCGWGITWPHHPILTFYLTNGPYNPLNRYATCFYFPSVNIFETHFDEGSFSLSLFFFFSSVCMLFHFQNSLHIYIVFFKKYPPKKHSWKVIKSISFVDTSNAQIFESKYLIG